MWVLVSCEVGGGVTCVVIGKWWCVSKLVVYMVSQVLELGGTD